MNKKLASLTLAGAVMLSVPVSTTFAASDDGKQEGTYDYDTDTYTETIDGEEVENDSDVNPLVFELAGGGTWEHGFIGLKEVYSYYDHQTKIHRASTSNHRATDRSAWIMGGNGTAKSTIAQSGWGNKANWSTLPL
ncbi:lactococcin 972 family bacteriocin [Oceanobacillus sp. J11TS1]|uniref:lactococcin 972 family bacteriocin n=1 Tax=Oceanobacillus sp. J11TS1 TaxID=2807191 RepID=UPI001B18E855|nr:lactococcin 972 family bacteriocin [Oceanobacillus sp. J11TS1]GIO25049.1 hypothetical protein J11TS1_36300 [Oceanobacillus sp. J11TS1]